MLPEMRIRNNCEDAKGKTKFVFPSEQQWLDIPTILNFYDVSGMVERDESLDDESYVEAHAIKIGGDESPSSAGTPTSVSTPQSSISSRVSQAPSLSLTTCMLTPTSLSVAASPDSEPWSPTDRFILPALDGVASFEIKEFVNWPLALDTVEAVIFRHYLKHLADWLDMCDPSRTFKTLIPRLAMSNHLLQDAIITFASRHLAHLSRHNDRDHQLYTERYTHFFGRCLPALRKSIDYASGKNATCFGAAIMLRVVEEMNEYELHQKTNPYQDGIRHFVKSFALLGTTELVKGTVSAAAYWVGLRQEIYTSVMHRVPISEFHLDIPLVNRCRTHPEDDYDWANWAVAFCAHVLNFCLYYEPPEQTRPVDRVQRFEELTVEAKRWWDDTPLMACAKQTLGLHPFPEQWFHSSCQVTGMQHYILGLLFLESNNPDSAASATDARVQELVREILGIGRGNQETPPSMFTACMAIAAFGDRFTERRDQEAMVDMLIQTENDHARPTTKIQNRLKKAWGWQE